MNISEFNMGLIRSHGSLYVFKETLVCATIWVDLACFGGVLKLVVWFAPWMTVGCEPVIQLQETSDLLL